MILHENKIANLENEILKYDDYVIVKSRQALNNYSDIKYIKENIHFGL